MKRFIIAILILFSLSIPVYAAEITAPEVPEMGKEYMPENTESFAEGLWSILKTAVSALKPELASACRVCLKISCLGILLSVFQNLEGTAKQGVNLIAVLLVSNILLSTGNTMIGLANDTVFTISEYGKLLLPVMAATLAAQGGTAGSAALYTSTAIFSGVLSKLISNILIPGVYSFLALSVAASATDNKQLNKLKDTVIGLARWTLKTLLGLFTGFMTVTGVISGTTDAATAKLTRTAISGMVPVVGGILSEATESVLIGAGMVKNAAGIYGLLAAAAVCIAPFIQIGVQYLLLKATGIFCELFAGKQVSQILHDYSGAMGLLLGMTGGCTMLLTISIICFMKGMA